MIKNFSLSTKTSPAQSKSSGTSQTDFTSRRTYSQLKEFSSWFESYDPLGDRQALFIKHFLNTGGSTARVYLGCRFLRLDPHEAIEDFKSNRFFLDSLGVSLMPDSKTLEETRVSFHASALAEGFSESPDDMIDQLIESTYQVYIDAGLPYFFRNHTIPKITEYSWNFLDQQGYLIIENALPLDLCDYVLDRLRAIAYFEISSQRGGYLYGSGRMQRVFNLVAKDEVFRDLLLHPICEQVMSRMFSRPTLHDLYYLTSFHGNIIKAGGEPQIWHVDANVPEPLPPWIIRSNSNYVLHDFTEDNGATEVVPGSHRLNRKPSKQESKQHSLETVKLCAPKGSLIFWHGHLWHRSGFNRSTSERVALLAGYSASFLREMCMEENPYLYLSANASDTMSCRLKRLIGWNHGAKVYA